MKSLLTLVGLFVLVGAYSQDNNPVVKLQIVEQIGKENYTGMVQTYDTRYEGVKGSPFMNEDWQIGSVTYIDGKQFTGIPLKYNIHNNELWVKNQVGQEMIVFKSKLKEFTIIDENKSKTHLFIKARYIPGLAQLLEHDKIVQILYDQEFLVACTQTKLLKKADYKNPYSSDRKYDEFVQTDPKYYLVQENENVSKLKPKKKAFLKIFDQKANLIRDYLMENDLDFNAPEEVSKLLAVVNSN